MLKEDLLKEGAFRELPSVDKEFEVSTLFRKFDEGISIFQFNKDGKQIGGIMIATEHWNAIQEAPYLKAGDGKTPQP